MSNIEMKKSRVKKAAKKPLWQFCKEKFVEFCKRTDLHGFKYIVMEDLNVAERSIWAVAVVISIICAAYFVITAYRWYARNPIVTVIESTQGAIWDVPFPSVTVCDLNIISRRAARAFSYNLTLPNNVTADFVFETLRIAPLLHSIVFADSTQKQALHKLQDVLDMNDITMEGLFQKLSPAASCNDLVERCMWKTTIYRCEQLFQHVMTSIALCCTFNYFAVDTDINAGLIRMSAPRRVASCGYQTALTALLRTDPSDYYSSDVASFGALVFIDNAYNWPDLDTPVRLVNPATEVLIALSPERTYSTPGIKSFSPKQRQCYYNDEVKIGDFNQYSFHNCMAIQKIEILKKYCECVPFFFPMKGTIRVCNFRDIECVEHVLRPIINGEDIDEEIMSNLNCLPECEHYDYRLEVALGKLARNTPLSGIPFYDNINLENRSVLNVFFNDLVSTRYRRDVYLNWQNILAAFGGLLSLMLGFTLVSGFDFLMFFVLQVAYEFITQVASNHQEQNVINVREKTIKFGKTSYGIRRNLDSETRRY
ncbi:sodium channel protein Nach-like [Aricia agestis]|uniref:sodium channel protein Nach-like n=1 Tax=Aricia agestis TaxID=91739 RepID=UPI001C204102|nr:sodium channel protein Nach-like [Aricia agestis]